MKTRLLQSSLAFLLLLAAPVRADDTPLAGTDLVLPAETAVALATSAEEWTVAEALVGGRTGYLHPFISVGERYTDNFYNSESDPQSEYTTIITPGLWLVAPPSRQQLLRVNTMVAMPGGLEITRFRTETARRFQGYALYRADIEKHDRFSAEDRTNHRGEGFIHYQAPGGFSLELLDMYEQEQDPFYSGSAATNQLDRFESNLLHALVGIPLTAKTDIRADYSNYRIKYDSELNSVRQREDNEFSVRVSSQVFARSEVFLLYEHVDIDYDRELFPDSTEDHTFVGIEWKMTAKSRGRVMLGYGQKEFNDPAREDYGDPIGEARLDYRLTPKSAVYLQVIRKTNELDTPSGVGALALQVDLGYRQQLLPRLTLAADGYYLYEDYRGERVIDGLLGVREDNYYGVGLALGYTPRKWLSVDVGYRYLQRESNFPTLSYRNNSAFLRVTAAL